MKSGVYHLQKLSIPMHQLQTASRNCCPAMADMSYIQTSDELEITVATSGLFHLKTFLTAGNPVQEHFSADLSLFKEVLGWLRRILEALDIAEEYFISFDSIGLELDSIYFENRKGRALLLLSMPTEKDLIERLHSLCMEIFFLDSRSNADVIAQRLVDLNAEALLDKKAILRLLSSWAYELGS